MQKESELRQPICQWLRAANFLPAIEFWLHGAGVADIVAGLYGPRIGRRVPPLEAVIAVELKLHDFAEVLRQAKRNYHHCDWSYVAMPVERINRMRPATLQQLTDAGIGLLAVDQQVQELIAPRKGPGLPAWRNQYATLWRRVRHEYT